MFLLKNSFAQCETYDENANSFLKKSVYLTIVIDIVDKRIQVYMFDTFSFVTVILSVFQSLIKTLETTLIIFRFAAFIMSMNRSPLKNHKKSNEISGKMIILCKMCAKKCTCFFNKFDV